MIKKILKRKINEEAVANSSGGANIAGIGVDNPSKGPNFGEPGRKKEDQPILRRMVNTEMFAGKKVFVVPSSVYEKARLHKAHRKHWTTYLDEKTDYGRTIREFANKNPKEPVILKNESTGYMCYARYGKK